MVISLKWFHNMWSCLIPVRVKIRKLLNIQRIRIAKSLNREPEICSSRWVLRVSKERLMKWVVRMIVRMKLEMSKKKKLKMKRERLLNQSGNIHPDLGVGASSSWRKRKRLVGGNSSFFLIFILQVFLFTKKSGKMDEKKIKRKK